MVPYRTDRDHDVASLFGCEVFKIVDFIDKINPVESGHNKLLTSLRQSIKQLT